MLKNLCIFGFYLELLEQFIYLWFLFRIEKLMIEVAYVDLLEQFLFQ